MSVELRDYQVRMYDEARELRRQGATSMVLQAPTGAGKTLIASHLLKICSEKGFRAWFLVHRREILNQSLIKLSEAGVSAGIVASSRPTNSLAPVQVCSVQTLARRHFKLERPHLIVHDECHHIAAATWAAIHAAYPDAVHIGLSATPERLDGQGLGKYFQHLLLGPSVAELIDQGYLSPYRLFAPHQPDMSGVETVAGDYNKKQVNERMSRSAVVGDTVGHYTKYVYGKRAIIFMWSVESSIDMAVRFNAAGIPAAHIDGGTDDRTRDRAVQMFRDGQSLVLTQVDICSEGFDLPACDAGFFCRPTKSLTLHLQQIGRCMRPAEGKVAYLFDQAGNSRRLGLPDDEREWSLEGSRHRKKKKKDNEDAVRVCPKCTEAYAMHVRVCRCGYVLVQSRDVDVDTEAELTEVDAQRMRWERMRAQSEAKDMDSLVRFAEAKGYKNPRTWARIVWNAREEKARARAAKKLLARQPTAEVAKEAEEAWLF